MKILAINPFHGGSHKAFLDGWVKRSRHQWTVLTLPDTQWRWRMLSSAAYFAEKLRDMDGKWDVLFCTSMMNVAEFRGLAPPSAAQLPMVVYFHENQLTYPHGRHSKHDWGLIMVNFLSQQAADAVWFNSAYHRDDFRRNLRRELNSSPGKLFAKSEFTPAAVHYPGINVAGFDKRLYQGPLRLCWVARWEEDKNPQLFFDTLYALKERGIDFRVNVLGESPYLVPDCFLEARENLSAEIEHWGYMDSYQQYLHVLRESHLVFSSAEHEFFGIGVLEAVGAGCLPIVPQRLAYPEVLEGFEEFFYNQRYAPAIAEHVIAIAEKMKDALWYDQWQEKCRRRAQLYCRDRVSLDMDDAIDELVRH